MYEIHMPIIMLAKMQLDKQGDSYKPEAKKQFQRAILNLKMSLEILKHEPEGSFGYQVYSGARDSVPQLESFAASQL